jgi:hypothetical protein
MSRSLMDELGKIILLGYLPAKIGTLIPKVEALSRRLPTITTQELAGELEQITRTLEAFRALEYDLADLNLSVEPEEDADAARPVRRPLEARSGMGKRRPLDLDLPAPRVARGRGC